MVGWCSPARLRAARLETRARAGSAGGTRRAVRLPHQAAAAQDVQDHRVGGRVRRRFGIADAAAEAPRPDLGGEPFGRPCEALAHVREHYDVSTMVAGYAALYDSLVA